MSDKNNTNSIYILRECKKSLEDVAWEQYIKMKKKIEKSKNSSSLHPVIICYQCGKTIENPQYGVGDINWCSIECKEKGEKRMARECMNDKEKEFFDFINTECR